MLEHTAISLCGSNLINPSAVACDIRPTRIEYVNLYACPRSKRFLEKNIKERNYKKINKQIRKGTVIAKDHNGDKIYGVVLC